ncbi:hypothetical protein [Aquimarina sp. MMG016]|uniref:hypothetical protein n=1 Tax=Aquimarina sp. MMG016 TaxID=2822690 RepID=UPI001B3A4988|nr:hypothetical protein [Aquimarina sp. MMG016]MBQ4820017.1 hypothetical protein [Aquimarina sp. MMG016]
MKKRSFNFLLIFSLVFGNVCLSQQSDEPDVDRGVSYGLQLSSNENISIPLYTIKVEGVSIPISLSYNTKGMLVNEVPSNVGFGWKLHAGGEIEKTVNHLVDESPDGWFFHNKYDDLNPGVYNGNQARVIFESVDATPDTYRMKMSNGFFAEYTYDKFNQGGNSDPTIFNHSKDVSNITTDFYKLRSYGYGNYDEDIYETEEDFDITISSNKGINYSFRKGIKRNKSWDLERRRATYIDSSDIHNYYAHKITTNHNADFIKFDYTETGLNKFVLHAKATRLQTNSDPRTPPTFNDPIITNKYEPQISIQDVSRKDIKKISTPYETVEFIYKEESYYNKLNEIVNSQSAQFWLDDLERQKFKLLDEIIIHDHKGNYITGYKFNYTGQTQDQSQYEGEVKIKSILKYSKNHKDAFVYRKLDYYYQPNGRENAVSFAADVFGYPNGAQNNDYTNITPIYIYPIASEKIPNKDEMIKGVLQSITNSFGGKTEYVYKENKSGTMYYGGLLIDQINIYNENQELIGNTEYTYENPEGFGLAVYDQTYPEQGEVPNNVYNEGYYDEGLRLLSWETYFTKRDPIIDQNNLQYLTAYTVSNIPYSLMMDAPIADSFITNLQLQNFYQLKSGSFYKKVTTKKKNIINDQFEKGYIIQYYRPSLSGFRLRKLLEKIEYYNAANKKQKEVEYTYEMILKNQIDAYQFDNVHYTGDDGAVFRYNLEFFPIYNVKDVLKSVETTDYDNANNSLKLTNRKDLVYLNEGNTDPIFVDYNRVKSITHYFNNTLKEKTVNKYLSEYDNTNKIESLLYENPKVETNNWVHTESKWKLRSSSVIQYLVDGKPHKIGLITNNPATGEPFTEQDFISSSYDQDGNFQSLTVEYTEFIYDEQGKLKAQKDSRTAKQKLFQRGSEYDGLYVDAVLTTSDTSPLFIKKSFENPLESNVIKSDKAFSGEYVYTGNTVSLGEFPANYEVTYWSYTNNQWKHNSFVHQGGTLIITKKQQEIYIDEVRVCPKNSTIETYTLKPLIGTTSILNDRGDGQRIEYDVFGRNLFHLDQDGNILKESRSNLLTIDTNN